MPLCRFLHNNIVESGGDHDGSVCTICAIRNQMVLKEGKIARIIPERKLKDYINSVGEISPNCFSHDTRCYRKLSTILITDTFEDSINTFKNLTGISNLYGFAELSIPDINTQCPLLNVVKDDYAYAANPKYDFPTHCSLMSFSGKNMKELNQEFRYKNTLSKLAKLQTF